MQNKGLIDKQRLPKHVAIIMDGNGRWAQERGEKRIYGHQHGVTAVRETTQAAAELGIQYLTLYTFSTENWNRPSEEINALMSLFVESIERETPTLNKNNIRLMAIGDLERLEQHTREKFEHSIRETASNTGLCLVLALSYSSRWEITSAVKAIAKQVKAGKIDDKEIDEALITASLNTQAIPDPDLLIRTSGEQRISNFLLWQLAYSELYFTPVHWPDFRKENFFEAILTYQKRERRYGKTSAQLT